MSRLDELIEELCPNGVEYKKLGNIATISRGGSFQKKDYTENGVPCIHYGQIYTYYNLFAASAISCISEETAKKQKFAEPGDIIMAVTSENMDDVCKCVAWLGNKKIAVSGHTAIIHHTIDPKYLTYWFHTAMFYQQKTKIAHGTKVIEVAPAKLADVLLPVPPLPVQREIARILDNFTEITQKLTAELEAELSARKQQYEYYRNRLLTFDVHGGGTSRAVQRTLGDIAKFVYGYTDKAKDTGDVRFIRITDINDDGCLDPSDAKYVDLTEESKKYLLKKGDLLLARTGATYGKTLFFDSDEPAVYASFLIKIVLDKTVIRNRYYWHFSKSSLYREQAEKYVSKGGQQQFNANAVSRVKIPVPSLEVQDRIIGVLDNFDVICTDLNIGLPAEIDARQKQYEYYRDKLLSFEEKT